MTTLEMLKAWSEGDGAFEGISVTGRHRVTTCTVTDRNTGNRTLKWYSTNGPMELEDFLITDYTLQYTWKPLDEVL